MSRLNSSCWPVEKAEGLESMVDGVSYLRLLPDICLRAGIKHDKECKHEDDEVRIGHQPSLVIYVGLSMVPLHAAPFFTSTGPASFSRGAA